MSAKSAYPLRKRPDAASFAAAWDDAARLGLNDACCLAIERAIEGVVEPVFFGDRQVGERRRFNDRLLMAALRNAGPPPSPAASAAAFQAALEALCPTLASVETPN